MKLLCVFLGHRYRRLWVQRLLPNGIMHNDLYAVCRRCGYRSVATGREETVEVVSG